jgi:hypothetical protein
MASDVHSGRDSHLRKRSEIGLPIPHLLAAAHFFGSLILIVDGSDPVVEDVEDGVRHSVAEAPAHVASKHDSQ